MSDAIIIAVVAAFASVGGAYLGTKQSNKAWGAKVELRLDNLEKKMDKHNSFMERLCVCEAEIKILKEK